MLRGLPRSQGIHGPCLPIEIVSDRKKYKLVGMDIEASIDPCRDRALNKAHGIIEQHLVIADIHTDRR
jgi:hypothetical protein